MDQTGKDPIEGERELKEWLESALGQYNKAEPRAGLENRILATLQSEGDRIAAQRRGWWALGTAAAVAALVAAVWIGEVGRVRSPVGTEGTSTTHGEELRASIQDRRTPEAAPSLTKGYAPSKIAERKPASRPTRNTAAEREPKLAQFPSPQPLSEQEQILMSYVANYPGHAALVARARSEALQRDHAEEMSADSSDDESSGQRVR